MDPNRSVAIGQNMDSYDWWNIKSCVLFDKYNIPIYLDKRIHREVNNFIWGYSTATVGHMNLIQILWVQ